MSKNLDDLDSATLLECYSTMIRIRAFEEKATELFKKGELPGFLHSSVGQEAVSAGYTNYLRTADYITSTHRGHGHLIGKGVELNKMFAELYGRDTGACRGRGGSMHIMDASVGVLGANGIVGGGITVAVGAALGIQQLGRDSVVVCFFGDGAVNIGGFHEGINLAAIWKLPILFVCENNGYAESTAFRDNIAANDLLPRAAGYGIAGDLVDGNDIIACLASADEAISRARRGDGPTLIQANTYRWGGHHLGDTGPYRTAEEVAEWKERDPLKRLEAELSSRLPAIRKRRKKIESSIAGEIDSAVEFARNSPAPSLDSVLDYVYASNGDLHA